MRGMFHLSELNLDNLGWDIHPDCKI
jgi:hypothetical protein